jgi:endonuclease/exonuclease/phosphatase family metal-dependent hydrolase
LSPLKCVTLNLLNDRSRWPQRRASLAAQLAELQPDVIALQEVTLPDNNAQWLADQLGGYALHFSPKTGGKGDREGIAILSRRPIERAATLDLQTQSRVAQLVEINYNAHALVVVNVHLHWWPGESNERNRQVRLIFDWLKDCLPDRAVVVCGDFNGTPESTAIQLMRQRFTSAYAARHGREPEYTCPTPLVVGQPIKNARAVLRSIRRVIIKLATDHTFKPWRGTLDYIFVNDRVRVLECDMTLNKPAPDDPTIYPSDHFGLTATLEVL